jgi:hypothetical protein
MSGRNNSDHGRKIISITIMIKIIDIIRVTVIKIINLAVDPLIKKYFSPQALPPNG